MTTLDPPRLLLRPLVPDDAPALLTYVADIEVMRYDQPWPDTEPGIREAIAHFQANPGFWAICLRDTGQLIGHLVCRQTPPEAFGNWDLGIGLNPAFHRRGYATEACTRLLDHLFTAQHARRVTATCDPRNQPAWHLLERLGFRREAHHIRPGFLRRTPAGDPDWSDAYEYALLASEWRAATP